MPTKKKPEAAEEKPAALIFLILKETVSGLVPGRVVTASETRAQSLQDDGQAELANPAQLKISGTSVPHLPD